MIMNYGDKWKFAATSNRKTKDRREVYQLRKSGSATGKTYRLYKFDGSEMNFLEDFNLKENNPSREKLISAVRQRIAEWEGGQMNVEIIRAE